MLTKRILFLIILLGAISLSACRQKASEPTQPHLGETAFRPTGHAAAQPAFEEGLLLLHSFEFDDAKDAFLRAQEQDSEMAMAYWGEAMTHNHPLWRQQDRQAGLEALAKLAPTAEERLEKTRTDLEKDLMRAIEVLYGEGKKTERDSAYAAFMEKLYKKYPGQQEVAAFYALSLLAAVPVGRDYEMYGLGAKIAQGILKENPNHPGALHYLIHAYDDPNHAALAIQAADSYAKVAPDAAHALHMPSHIYVALGMWDEVVSSNIASYEASVKRMERLDLDHNARSYHAFAWLMYGHLQKGNLEAAEQIMTDMVRYTEELPSPRARDYLNLMQGNYLVETEDWEGAFANLKLEVEDLNIVSQASHLFVAGIKAFRNENAILLADLIKQLESKRQKASLQISDRGVPLCSAGGSSSDNANQLDLDKAQVMEFEMRGLYARLINKLDMADQWMSQASELERSIDYSYGPPEIVYPSFELYGEWLLEEGRAEEALEQFGYALARGPKRVRALQGQLSAAKQLGKTQLISQTEAILDQIAKKPSET